MRCECIDYGATGLRQIVCGRPDHNALMALVICARCHARQPNDHDANCERCGHELGRYA